MLNQLSERLTLPGFRFQMDQNIVGKCNILQSHEGLEDVRPDGLAFCFLKKPKLGVTGNLADFTLTGTPAPVFVEVFGKYEDFSGKQLARRVFCTDVNYIFQ